MKTYLRSVAESLYATFKSDMSRLVVVFPNKRASLFLNRELAEVAQEPVLAPCYKTINDLFQELALTDDGRRIMVADSIEAVCRLYDIYKEVMELNGHQVEPIDKFYGWGEVMLSDFNDIDKQMVDPDQLFRYVEDWETMRDTSFLNEEQRKVLEHYFSSFKDVNQAKQNFLNLWKAMPEIYARYNRQMLKEGMLYDGALSRYVVRHELFGAKEGTDYAFVGFNILSPVQKELLMGMIKRVGREHVRFYWDYDPALRNAVGIDRLFHEACQYIEQYQTFMSNTLEEGWSQEEPRTEPQHITYVRTDTSNAQVHYVPEWLKDKEVKRSAVVLADEKLLPQVLTTLPVMDVNITMGYPLSNTPVIGFVQSLVDLQLNGRRRSGEGFYEFYLDKVRRQPLFVYLDGWHWDSAVEHTGKAMLNYVQDAVLAVMSKMPLQFTRAEQKQDNTNKLPPSTILYEEALFRTYQAIVRIAEQNIEDCGLACRLLDKALHSVSVPFHGEMMKGLQVMGVLETRALDFDDVVVLSAQDGILPQTSNATSLIPYCLREPFGLSTEKEQVNVYAYNFFRMLRRSKSITLMFSAAGTASTHGEMSRFMRQLLAETDLEISDCRLNFSEKKEEGVFNLAYAESIPKTDEIMRRLYASFDGMFVKPKSLDGEGYCRMLSPSAINKYLECPMQFYYRYVEGIKVKDKLTSSLSDSQFGTVFHKAAECYYASGDSDVDKAVEEAFRIVIFDKSEIKGFEGELIIQRNVIRNYLKRLIALDERLGKFKILEEESSHSFSISVQDDKGMEHTIVIGGKIDRVDQVEKHPRTEQAALRVIDYKTGGKVDNKVMQDSDFSTLLDKDKRKQNQRPNLLQSFLYSLALSKSGISHRDGKDVNIMPGLIYIGKASDAESYDERTFVDKTTPVDSFKSVEDAFEKSLKHFLQEELFSKNVPFERTNDSDSCKNCDYRLLCGKLKSKF